MIDSPAPAFGGKPKKKGQREIDGLVHKKEEALRLHQLARDILTVARRGHCINSPAFPSDAC